MCDRVLIDGVESTADWLDDRGFQYGDGLFETIAVVDGDPCLWDAHMARLNEGCRRLHLPQPDQELLADETRELASAGTRGVVKLYWTAGDSQRGYRRTRPLSPRRILRLSRWPYQASPDGWSVRLCEQRLSSNPTLAGIKHMNRLDQVLARAEWDTADIDEGIMLDQEGHPVCGTLSNLFVQAGDSLVTPPIDRAGVAGVVRRTLLEQAALRGARIDERTLSVDELHSADALYMSNALIGVVRVARLETTGFGAGVPEHPLIAAARERCHRPDRPT